MQNSNYVRREFLVYFYYKCNKKLLFHRITVNIWTQFLQKNRKGDSVINATHSDRPPISQRIVSKLGAMFCEFGHVCDTNLVKAE